MPRFGHSHLDLMERIVRALHSDELKSVAVKYKVNPIQPTPSDIRLKYEVLYAARSNPRVMVRFLCEALKEIAK